MAPRDGGASGSGEVNEAIRVPPGAPRPCTCALTRCTDTRRGRRPPRFPRAGRHGPAPDAETPKRGEGWAAPPRTPALPANAVATAGSCPFVNRCCDHRRGGDGPAEGGGPDPDRPGGRGAAPHRQTSLQSTAARSSGVRATLDALMPVVSDARDAAAVGGTAAGPCDGAAAAVRVTPRPRGTEQLRGSPLCTFQRAELLAHAAVKRLIDDGRPRGG